MGCQWSQHQRKRAKQYQVSEDTDGRRYTFANDLRMINEGQTSAVYHASSHILVSSGSKPDAGEAQFAAHQQPASGSATSPSTAAACKRVKLNPEDFMFTGLRSQSRVKQQGSVKGQQFIIDDCEGCDLYVLDQCASVTIDDCTNCRIFIGPTEASIFMRGCSNCILAAVTRQMRCRDCSACSLMLMCRTRPIIESSTGMAFGCFDAPYAGLAAQMAAAQLSAFHNFWSDVYDFTPAAPAARTASRATAGAFGSTATDNKVAVQQSTRHCNWELLPPGASVIDALGVSRAPEIVQLALGMVQVSAALGAAAALRQQEHSLTVTSAGAAAEPTEAAAANHGEGPALAPTAENTTDQQPLSAQAPTAADRMSVIVSQGVTLAQAGSSTGCQENRTGSCCHYIFVLFPAGQSSTALQWVHTHTLQRSHIPDAVSNLYHHGWLAEVHGASSASVHVAGCNCVVDRSTAQVATDAAAAVPASLQPAGISAGDNARERACVLFTNEAPVPAAVLQQMAAAAVWSKEQLKVLQCTSAKNVAGAKGAGIKSAVYVGVELHCSSEQMKQLLVKSAHGAGALTSSSCAAALLFRNLGVEG